MITHAVDITLSIFLKKRRKLSKRFQSQPYHYAGVQSMQQIRLFHKLVLIWSTTPGLNGLGIITNSSRLTARTPGLNGFNVARVTPWYGGCFNNEYVEQEDIVMLRNYCVHPWSRGELGRTTCKYDCLHVYMNSLRWGVLQAHNTRYCNQRYYILLCKQLHM